MAVQNRPAEAETAFQKSIQLDPNDTQAHFNYSILLVSQNRQAEAENEYKKCIELNPNDAFVYNSYGVLLAAQNRFVEAENAYKNTLNLTPPTPLCTETTATCWLVRADKMRPKPPTGAL